jgi:hypothetical protein
VESKSLENPEKSEFRQIAEKIFNFSTFHRGCEQLSFFMRPEVVPLFKFELFSSIGSDYMKKVFRFIMNHREKSSEKRNGLIVDSMLEIRNSDFLMTENEQGELVFDNDILTSQAGAFFRFQTFQI